jgi:hypothetical protein
MSFLATTAGISGDDVRDLMVAAVEQWFSECCVQRGMINIRYAYSRT